MTKAIQAEPWHAIGLYAFDCDPYTDVAITYYHLRRQLEEVAGHLPQIVRRLV